MVNRWKISVEDTRTGYSMDFTEDVDDSVEQEEIERDPFETLAGRLNVTATLIAEDV